MRFGTAGFISDRVAAALLVVAALAGLLVTVLTLAEQHRGEVGRLRTQIEALSNAQEQLRSDVLHGFRRQSIVASTAPQRDIVIALNGAPFKGNADAPITIVEFADFESADCARYARETLPRIERDYIDAGKVKYVFRNLPVEAVHKLAFRAHEAAGCAGEQGKFWQMHDRLFASAAKLNGADMPLHAQALGLDAAKFLTCFDGGLDAPSIRRDIAEAEKNGVVATPTFFLGRTPPASEPLHVFRMIQGAQPYADFKEVIDALLEMPPAS